MNMEHTGSAIIQPQVWIKMEDMITPILPRVSARMCRNIPIHTYRQKYIKQSLLNGEQFLSMCDASGSY